MPKVYDLAVVVGSYQKDGQEKKKYKNVGVVMESDKGMYILLDKTFNPPGVPGTTESVLISMMQPRDERQRQQDNLDDIIPF